MKFISARLATILIIVTCAGLYGLDYYKNPQLWHHPAHEMEASGKGARLVLWMNHLCCTGCLSDIRQALAATRHLLEMYRRQLADEKTRRTLQRLNRRLLAVASRLDRLAKRRKMRKD